MKIIYSVIFLLISSFLRAQQAWPCVEYHGSGAGTYTSSNCIYTTSSSGTSPVNGSNICELVSGKEVQLLNGFSANNLTTGSFYAHINTTALETSVFDPVDITQGVMKYEKLEIGIKLPEPVKSYINNFINGTGSPVLNPFNPIDIDVYAEFQNYHANDQFFHNYWGSVTKVNGFFYEEYERDVSDPNHFNWHHNSINTDYTFRVRFAPPATGSWRCKITMVTPYGTFTSDYLFFNCINSSNPGFLYIGSNQRYFKLGSNMFFPVGQNIYPSDGVHDHALDPVLPPWHWEHAKVAEMIAYEDKLEEFQQLGGNYFRYLVAPWNTEIEFEKLNNYSDRMDAAWEFDRVLDKCKELDLRMHLCMQIHYAFENPSVITMNHWDWSSNDIDNIASTDRCSDNASSIADGYCYHRESSLSSPVDFLTSPGASVFYQMRLRYMIARWGYSTNIGTLQLVSEINNIGQSPNWACGDLPVNTNPYGTDATVPPKVRDWHYAMADYIKNTLGHKEHLLTVSYTGTPAANDMSYYSNNIDLADYNHYTACHDRFSTLYSNVSNITSSINKPLFVSETGSVGCDGGLEIRKSIWVGPFTGVAGIMEWGIQDNSFHIWNEGHYNNFKDFISGLDFDQGAWQSQHDYRHDDNKADAFSLVDASAHKAIGVIMNRTFNYITTDVSTCLIPDANGNTYGCDCNICFSGPEEVVPAPSGGNKLEIDMNGVPYTDYVIEWYDVLEYHSLGTSTVSLNALGKLELNHPPLSVNEGNPNDFQPIIGYHVWKQGNNFKSFQIENETVSNLSLIPNPNNGNFTLTSKQTIENVKITDLLGNIIYTQNNLNVNSASINLASVESGIYLLYVQESGSAKTSCKKVVIEK